MSIISLILQMFESTNCLYNLLKLNKTIFSYPEVIIFTLLLHFYYTFITSEINFLFLILLFYFTFLIFKSFLKKNIFHEKNFHGLFQNRPFPPPFFLEKNSKKFQCPRLTQSQEMLEKI